ncbi:MAG: HNH endonuclease signature motif containing protein [Acidimicrobiales bacterium]
MLRRRDPALRRRRPAGGGPADPNGARRRCGGRCTRDGTCRFPGCTHRGWLDAHHQHHWTDGGPTNLDNLLLLCRRHHRTVHEGGWTVHRNNNNDGWTFTNPNGWSPQQPPTIEPHDIELGLPENLDPHAVRPYWIDRPHYPYIISVFADPPPPDPQWN